MSESNEPRPITGRERQILALAILGIVLLCLLMNRFSVGNIPHGWDAVSYYFQAQVFAEGHVTAPETPFPDLFWVAHIVNDRTSRYSQYPPGWPLLLAPAMAIGAPELANALLAGLCAFLIWLIADRLLGRREAWTAIALFALSPFCIFMGANFLSHMPCATMIAMLQWSMIRSLSAERLKSGMLWGLLAGGAMGMAFLIRPYSAVLGLICSCFVSMTLITWRPKRWTLLFLSALLPGALAIGVYLLFNRMTTGDAMTPGYLRNYPDLNFLGVSGEHRESVWQNLAVNIPKGLRGLTFHIWGWPTTDLLFLALLPILRFKRRTTWVLIGAVVLYLVGHSLYYYFDLYYGPRTLFESMVWMLIASAAGAVALWDFIAKWPKSKWLLIVLGVVVVLWGLNAGFLKRAMYYRQSYCGQGTEALHALRGRDLDNAIVFIRCPDAFAYANFSPLNDPNIAESPVIFARWGAPERMAALVQACSRREHWILDLGYLPIMGLNDYADRFALKRAEWTPLIDELGAAQSANQNSR